MFTLAPTRRRGPLVSASHFALTLRPHDLWRVQLRDEPLPIRCLRGSVWITREGSSEDVMLRAGSECQLRGRGLALVGAVSDAEVAFGT